MSRRFREVEAGWQHEVERATASTASRILDVAERLVQRRGYNAFSYADVAAELHVTKAALHYHFARQGRARRGAPRALRRRGSPRRWPPSTRRPRMHRASSSPTPTSISRCCERQRMCLCGMLAAEFETLPEPMRAIVIRFFDDNETWLSSVLEQGRQEGTLHFTGSTSEAARFVVAALEGAMLVARPLGDVARFQDAARSLITGLANQSRTCRSGGIT